MADAALKAKIKDSLKRTYFDGSDDAIYVSDSDECDENIHVVVVSPKFQGKGLEEKTDLILAHLFQALPKDEWGKVTLSVGVSPEELKAI